MIVLLKILMIRMEIPVFSNDGCITALHVLQPESDYLNMGTEQTLEPRDLN